MSSQMRMVWPRPLKRKPQNEDQVTFKKSKEFKLRNWVVEQVNMKKTPCLFEMSFVFTCLKDNNFNDKVCHDEVERFKKCYMDSMKQADLLKLRRKNPGKVYADTKNLISAEVNAMFKKYSK